jgi:hypothetical protein
MENKGSETEEREKEENGPNTGHHDLVTGDAETFEGYLQTLARLIQGLRMPNQTQDNTESRMTQLEEMLDNIVLNTPKPHHTTEAVQKEDTTFAEDVVPPKNTVASIIEQGPKSPAEKGSGKSAASPVMEY